MEIFSKILFTDLFFFLIQYLQRTCDGHTQCDAITLKKIITYLLFLLLRFSQTTCKRHTHCDAIFLKSTFHRPVLFPNSVPTEEMRRWYSLWCSFSQKYFLQICSFSYFSTYWGHATAILSVMQLLSKKVLHTCCFSYFSFYRGHANAILSVMQFFSKVLFLDLFFFVIQYPQRTCDGHIHCDAITL